VTDDRAHWESTYAKKTPEEVSWYEPVPQRSLELIEATKVGKKASVLDVGGGASRLAGQLLRVGYTDVAVADISPTALAHARVELGSDAAQVNWIEADIRSHDFGRPYDLWHDRAVFHFMVTPADRDGYLEVLRITLRPGGHLIIATFGPQGPTRCSGLPVQRYSAEEMQRVLGDEFEPASASLATHETPSGATQQFLYARARRRTTEQPRDVVRRAHQALNSGDLDALVSLCDVEFRLDMSDRVFNPAVYEGHDGIRRFYSEVRDVWASYVWEPEELMEAGENVVALLRSTARGRGSGVEVERRTAMVWTIREERATALRFFRDRNKALEAVGLRR
jgi:ketosteroid isomerase-like protein/ubiquinone/menaquinone biosynthesis C-methylase UbiE